ncbi:ABC transporter permease [Candidatus Woesearchaeota archaeon]|nr:ABC transporter permease [Nanoarchaeota archaeon]MCB9370209.1 ABC transporter permease [Candidatus Woesearchaeota archaeon]USN44737.1 MAG: ABC transporter permease [Candidatus Woesearchaeota archaeon]
MSKLNETFLLNYRGFMTLLKKEMRRFLSIWSQTLLPAVITTVLYFVIFGNLIGSRVGEMDGVSYMAFIVPGLVMMQVIMNSYSNVVSSFFGAKFMKNIEEVLVSPLPASTIIIGFAAGGVARGFVVGLLVTAVSLFFVKLTIYSVSVVLSVFILSAILFSLAGFLNAVFAKKFDDVMIIPTFVLTPLTYLGGVFYSISLLPPFWQTLSLINPILYIVNAFRYGFMGVSDISLFFAYFMIFAFIIVLYLACLYFVRTGRGLRS